MCFSVPEFRETHKGHEFTSVLGGGKILRFASMGRLAQTRGVAHPLFAQPRLVRRTAGGGCTACSRRPPPALAPLKPWTPNQRVSPPRIVARSAARRPDRRSSCMPPVTPATHPRRVAQHPLHAGAAGTVHRGALVPRPRKCCAGARPPAALAPANSCCARRGIAGQPGFRSALTLTGRTARRTDEQRSIIRQGRVVMFFLLCIFILCAIFKEARLTFCISASPRRPLADPTPSARRSGRRAAS